MCLFRFLRIDRRFQHPVFGGILYYRAAEIFVFRSQRLLQQHFTPSLKHNLTLLISSDHCWPPPALSSLSLFLSPVEKLYLTPLLPREQEKKLRGTFSFFPVVRKSPSGIERVFVPPFCFTTACVFGVLLTKKTFITEL